MKKILKGKQAFSGRLIQLYVKRQRFPRGNIVNLEVVKHPGAVLIVPFLDKNRIILIKQYRPVINAYIWELPAGTLDKNEAPLKCAKRELKEEIGYQAKGYKRLGFIYPAPGYTTERILIFKAWGLQKVKASRQEDELIAPKVFSRREAKQLFNCGSLIDAKTICALKLAQIL